MSVRGIATPVRGSGKDQSLWKLEWTFGSSGAVTLDTSQSDQHPDIATPVDDGGTGIVSVNFPSCDRVWVLHDGIEPAAADLADPTDYMEHEIVSLDASAGTCQMRVLQREEGGTGLALADPQTGARGRLILLLENS